MRSVAVFMRIQIQLTAVCTLSDDHAQTFRSITPLIAGGYLKLLNTVTVKQL